MKKIVFCDIDGTIVDNLRGLKDITPKTKYAMAELKKDDYIFIASGRSKCMLPEEITKLNPSGYICANGAYAEHEGKVIYERYFAYEQLKELREYAICNNLNYYFESQECIYTNASNNKLHQDFNAAWGLGDIYTSKDYSKDEHINIAMLACHTEEEGEKFFETFSSSFDIRHHHGFPSFDINLIDNNKGDACEKIEDFLNIAYEDAFAFGDGLNDIEMLKVVRYGIAMGNAFKEVKDIAFDITSDVLDDGFYNALVKYGLIKHIS